MFDTATNTLTHRIPVGYVQDVALSPDGNRLNTVGLQISTEGKVRPVISVINTANSSVVRTIPVGDFRSQEEGYVNAVEVTGSPDNRRVYALVIDSQQSNYVYSIRAYDTTTGALVDTYEDVGSAYGSIGQRGRIMMLSADGRYIYARDAAQLAIKVLETRTGNVVGEVPYVTSSPSVADMVVSPNGRQLYMITPDSSGFGGKLHVFDIIDGR